MTRAIVDWERIEAEYRAGILSLREIVAPHKITEGALRKRAKRDGWERDLGAKIQAKADALVRKAAVRSEVRTSAAVTEKVIIDANAVDVATIRIAHRTDVTRFRALVIRLLSECEAEAADPSMFAELGDLMRKPDDGGRLNDVYLKVISLPQRIKGVKELADALKTLVGLEREAYGIDTATPPEDPGKLPAGMTRNDVLRRLAYALTATEETT